MQQNITYTPEMKTTDKEPYNQPKCKNTIYNEIS